MGQLTGQSDATNDDRYVVISADGHAGGNVADYRPYLEQKWLDQFDVLGGGLRDPLRRSQGRPR